MQNFYKNLFRSEKKKNNELKSLTLSTALWERDYFWQWIFSVKEYESHKYHWLLLVGDILPDPRADLGCFFFLGGDWLRTGVDSYNTFI